MITYIRAPQQQIFEPSCIYRHTLKNVWFSIKNKQLNFTYNTANIEFYGNHQQSPKWWRKVRSRPTTYVTMATACSKSTSWRVGWRDRCWRKPLPFWTAGRRWSVAAGLPTHAWCVHLRTVRGSTCQRPASSGRHSSSRIIIMYMHLL